MPLSLRMEVKHGRLRKKRTKKRKNRRVISSLKAFSQRTEVSAV
jgi:hypothetical protein